MPKTLTIVLLLVLTAVVTGGAVFWLKPSTQVDVSVVVERMRDVAALATTEWTMSAFVEQEFKSQGIKKFRSDYVIARCTGKVTGSVDLDKATIETRKEADGRHVVIHFQRGSLLVSGVEFDPSDQDAFKTISCATMLPSALGQPANVSQVDAMRREGMKRIRETAIDKGIVEKTMENAKTVLGNFVGTFGYKVTITFDEKAYDPAAGESYAAAGAAK